MIRVGVLGTGKLGEIIIGALQDGQAPGCECVGVMGQRPDHAAEVADKYQCRACTSIEELMAQRPDYVIEAAKPAALKQYAAAVMEGKSHIICLSGEALADPDFYHLAYETAEKNGVKLYVAPGVLGGFDMAASLKAMAAWSAIALLRRLTSPITF